MQHYDFSKYVGIPFEMKGRDRSGIDCWGLVRLVYREQLGIDLPSLAELYPDENTLGALAEAVARRREGWQEVGVPEVGDLVLLRHKGMEVHVGLCVGDGQFLHAFDGTASVIEKLTAVHWRSRIVGFFRYQAKAEVLEGEHIPAGSVAMSGLPHPLRTVRIEGTAPAGASVEVMVRHYASLSGWPEAMEISGMAWVDGRPVPRGQWGAVFPAPGSRVEFRVVAGKSGGGIFKIVAALAIAFFAPYVAVGLIGPAAGTVGALTTLGAFAAAGVAIVGNMLLNAIFPVRPPSGPSAGGAGRAYYALSNGSNQQAPFGAIPVVLGRHRFAGPQGAVPWVEVRNNEKYLRMVVVWGYGPLAISNFRIGATDINLYEDVELETLTGVPGEDKTEFNAIYGKDITQISVGVNPEGGGAAIERVIDEAVSRIEVNLTAPGGLYSINTKNGKYRVKTVQFIVRYKRVGTSTWYDFGPNIMGRSFSLPTAPIVRFGLTDYATRSYTWFIFYLEDGAVKVKSGGAHKSKTSYSEWGFSESANDGGGGYGMITVDPFPVWPAGVKKLWSLCILNDPGTAVAGDEVVRVTEMNDERSGVTGFELTATGTSAVVADGHVIDVTDEVSLSGASHDPIDKVLARNVPTGQYLVYVARVTPDSTAGNINDKVTLTSITGIGNRLPINPRVPLAMTACRIKSSNQLNGNMEGLSALLQSICLDYVNATIGWRRQVTSNPASLYRYVLQHPANPRPRLDSEIDLAALADWHGYCKQNGFEYNGVVVMQRGVDDLLRDIAAAGRASPARPNGLYSVVIDRPQSTIVQHFTPHNSWGFEGSRRFPRLPHALRVGFSNEERDYQADERTVYNDGYSAANATEIESIELPGVTSPALVHKHGRFHMAQAQLRPETYSLYCDIEHLICTRGDRVKVTHDIPAWGIGSGRIKTILMSGAKVSGVVLDEDMPMQAGQAYSLRYRRSATGSSHVAAVAAVAVTGYYDTLSFSSPITTQLPAPGDLVMFGNLNSESVDCVVLSIEPGENETARLTLVDYAPALAVVDTQPIPEWNSNITRPPGVSANQIRQKPDGLVFVSDETAMERLSGNAYRNNISVRWVNPAALSPEIDAVEIQWGKAGLWPGRVTASPTNRMALIGPVEVGSSYAIRLRYIGSTGRTGPWVNGSHIVTGALLPPPAVTGFSINVVGDVATLRWDNSPSINLSHWRIRHSQALVGASWQSSNDLLPRVSGSTTQAVVPAMVGTYLIKAVDDDGRESSAPALVVSTIAGLTELNVIEVVDEPGWPGSHDGTWAAFDGLRLDPADVMADWASLADVVSLARGVSGIRPQGIYEFAEKVGLGGVFTCRLTAKLQVTAENVGNTMAEWESLADVVSLAGDVGGRFDAWLEISTAQDDDPEGAPTWGPWSRLVVGYYTARAFRFRLVLTSEDVNVTPVVTAARVGVDMPDRIVSANDIACPAAGLSVTYPGPFRVRPSLGISAEDMATGDYYRITSATKSGFFIRFYNAAGAGVARTFDYLSKGYGAEL